MKKIWILIRKEWSEVFKNRLVLFSTSFLPLVFAAIPLGMLYALRSSGDTMDTVTASDMPPSFVSMCDGLSGMECMEYYIVTQFILLFMMIPMIIPMTFAAYSIVGEKTTRTLEPLLATPISTLQLLAGKALAAVIPGIGATWASFLIYGTGALIMSVSPAVMGKFTEPLWLMAILVVGPLLAVASVSLALMVSSRVTDPRIAEQISAVFIIPLVALFVGQSSGLIMLNESIILWMAGGLFVLDIMLLAFATHFFQRENILTRWK